MDRPLKKEAGQLNDEAAEHDPAAKGMRVSRGRPEAHALASSSPDSDANKEDDKIGQDRELGGGRREVGGGRRLSHLGRE